MTMEKATRMMALHKQSLFHLNARLASGPQDGLRLARVAEAWTSVNQAARQADAYNLDRKPLVFSVFAQLAQAARA